MKKAKKEYNVTYHPILDNFNEFDDVPRTEFDEKLEFTFHYLISTSTETFN